jgi:hypothetical protein
MPYSIKPLDLNDIHTYPIAERHSRVSADDFAKPWERGGSLKKFLEMLPDILSAQDLNAVIRALADAACNKKTILVGMGAHVIKVGLTPIIIDLMRRKIITGIAMNGAGIIHDSEIAMTGRTSEDVAASLGSGHFGMAQETGEFLNHAIQKAKQNEIGLGEAVGLSVLERNLPFSDKSILAAGAKLNIPITIHVAMGTDIIHSHPGFDPAAAGQASHRDFRLFAAIVAGLEGGVYMNIGSAVILPEVFLKALTLARNLGHQVDNFTTVNMDFIRQYRPMTNVVNRPTANGGQGFHLTGCHEIMLPLIAAGVIEQTPNPPAPLP